MSNAKAFVDVVNGKLKELPIEVVSTGQYAPIRVMELNGAQIPVGFKVALFENRKQIREFSFLGHDGANASIALAMNPEDRILLNINNSYAISIVDGGSELNAFRIYHAV